MSTSTAHMMLITCDTQHAWYVAHLTSRVQVHVQQVAAICRAVVVDVVVVGGVLLLVVVPVQIAGVVVVLVVVVLVVVSVLLLLGSSSPARGEQAVIWQDIPRGGDAHREDFEGNAGSQGRGGHPLHTN